MELGNMIKRYVSNEKKIFTVAIAMFLVLTLATAMWIVRPNITGYSIYKIKSNQPNITIVADLINKTVDTQESNYTGTQVFLIDSSDKEKVLVNYETIKTDDTNDLCLDYQNDCDIKYYWGDNEYGYSSELFRELTSGEYLFLQKGLNTLTVKTYCKRFSCPQDISVHVDFIKQPSH